MNILDITIVLLLILSIITGYKKGVFKEIVLFVGTIIVYIISFLLKNKIGMLLCSLLPFFDFNGIPALNILIYQLVGFAIIAVLLFGVLSFVLKVTGILQKAADMSIVLSLPTRLLGALFGLINGYIVLFFVLLVISLPFRNNAIIVGSNLNNKILSNTPVLTSTFDGVDDIILKVCDLKVGKKSRNTINIELLDMYLDYNVVSKDELTTIVKSGKLDYIKGIEKYK